MQNRLHSLFENKKNPLLSIYFTAGFPNLEDTVDIIKALENAGVDMIEIGFPFSDPLADGPTIQASSQKAIENGMTLKKLFAQLSNIRETCQIPIILMGYLNPIMQYGEEAFLEKCAEIGVDGLIVPDVPLGYFEKNWQAKCEKLNLSFVPLITPDTSNQRIQTIDDLADAFIYMVSSNSITGTQNDMTPQIAYFERIQAMKLKNPTVIGFGIRDAATFSLATQYSEGAIIGSAFIKHLAKHGANRQRIYNFVNAIKKN